MSGKRQHEATGAVRGIVRQGDVLLVPVDELPTGRDVTVEEGSSFVLAEGEATGHAHVVHGRTRLLRSTGSGGRDGQLHLLVEEVATLVHDEHDPIPLGQGPYRVVRQREYQPRPQARPRERFRWVAD